MTEIVDAHIVELGKRGQSKPGGKTAQVISITINGAALTSPVTAAQITAACDDGDGANDIGFIFG